MIWNKTKGKLSIDPKFSKIEDVDRDRVDTGPEIDLIGGSMVNITIIEEEEEIINNNKRL